MRKCGRKINQSDIEHLEKIINANLPDDHKNFLLQYNGGRPEPDAYPVKEHREKVLGIKEFYGIDHEITSWRLDWNYEVFKDRIPKFLLPIACDGFGDQICLVLANGKYPYGTVVFWDLFDETDHPTYDNVYKIADNFTGFLDCLCEYPKDDDE